MQAKQSLAKWKFQVKQGFSFYSTSASKHELTVETIIDKVNGRVKKLTGKQGRLHLHELMVMLDDLTWVLERKLSNCKRVTFR